MKGIDRPIGHRSTLAAAAILVVAATLASAPQQVRAQCVGDCSGNGTVTIDEVVTLVDIALGTAEASTCTSGIVPPGAAVTVATTIQAVNSALHGCGAAFCGDGIVQSEEECDPGPGTCIGGANAGTSCTAESQCPGDGVCRDGIKAGWACSSNDDCPNSSCVHCKIFDKTTGNFDPNDGIPDDCGTYSASCGCASNCTFEKAVNITLVPGNNGDGTTIVQGTSGLIVYSPSLNVGIPFASNTVRQLIIGKEKDGKIPGVLKKATNNIIGIDVLNGQACICLRPILLRTCGGTLWEKDGKPSTDCSEGYTAGDSVCPAEKPCTFAYGPTNSGAGEVGCNGLDGVDVSTTQDSGGSANADCPAESPRCKAGPVITTRSNTGGPGSTVLDVTTELGFTLKPCTGTDPEYGADHMFCTDDDPKEGRSALPQVLTTGMASATVQNADLVDPSCNNEQAILCHSDNDCPQGQPCLPNNIGPYSSQGAPLSCSGLASDPPNVSGGTLAGGFPDLNAPTIMDIVVVDTQVAH